MGFTLVAREKLDADLALIRSDHLVVVELSEFADLVREPDSTPLAGRRGPERAGIEDIAATLTAAQRLPEDLTVRVVLPDGAAVVPALTDVEASFHHRAHYLASVAWREGMAVRATGLRQLPLGMTVAAVSWFIAYAAGYLATQVHGAGVGLLAVTAMIAITIAWVASWMIAESTLFDWRPAARQAAAFDLLCRARLEVVFDSGVPLR
jgi:hypothetical protein